MLMIARAYMLDARSQQSNTQSLPFLIELKHVYGLNTFLRNNVLDDNGGNE
jgi:hypothetical protein